MATENAKNAEKKAGEETATELLTRRLTFRKRWTRTDPAKTGLSGGYE
jgi:hypothetical protein